ncbi:MAG: AAA domain-containing protein [bacterium]
MQPFLERLAGLWARERATVTARAVAARRESTLAERVARGDALQSVEVDEVEVAPGDRTRLWLRRPPGGELRLRPGTPVRLWWTDPDDRDAVRGLADRVRGDRVAITVDGEVPDRILHGHFHVDLDDPQTVFTIGAGAIRWFQNARPREPEARLGAVLWGDEAPTFQAPAPWLPADAGLNATQRAAVDRALGAERLALIHGPPGTGKTRTLVEVIVQAVRRGQRVLACAMSNTATDHLAAGLLAAGLPIVRLGHPTRVAAAVEARSLDALLDASDAAAWPTAGRARRAACATGPTSAATGAAWTAAPSATPSPRPPPERDARDHVRRAQGAILQSAPSSRHRHRRPDGRAPRPDLRRRRPRRGHPGPRSPGPRGVRPGAHRHPGRRPRAAPPHRHRPRRRARGPRLHLLRARRPALARGRGPALGSVPYACGSHGFSGAHPLQRPPHGPRTSPPAPPLTWACAPTSRPTPLVLVDMAGKGCEDATDLEGSAYNDGQADRTVAEVRRLLSRGLAPADLAVHPTTPSAAACATPSPRARRRPRDRHRRRLPGREKEGHRRRPRAQQRPGPGRLRRRPPPPQRRLHPREAPAARHRRHRHPRPGRRLRRLPGGGRSPRHLAERLDRRGRAPGGLTAPGCSAAGDGLTRATRSPGTPGPVPRRCRGRRWSRCGGRRGCTRGPRRRRRRRGRGCGRPGR